MLMIEVSYLNAENDLMMVGMMMLSSYVIPSAYAHIIATVSRSLSN